jgi:hypothetical protein
MANKCEGWARKPHYTDEVIVEVVFLGRFHGGRLDLCSTCLADLAKSTQGLSYTIRSKRLPSEESPCPSSLP